MERRKLRKLPSDSFTNVDTLYEYRKDGQLAKEIDPRSNATLLTYDDARRLEEVEDAAGNSVTYARDGNGNVTTVTEFEDAQAGSGSDVTRTTNYTYDRRNLPLSQARDPGSLNITTSWKYDSRGNVVKQVDPRGNSQDMEYDGRNLVTRVIEDRVGSTRSTTTYAYDDNGNLIGVEDDNLNATTYSYDALDRRYLRTNADSTTFEWSFNGEGSVTGWEDENGTVVANTLDALGRVTSRSVTRASGVEGTTSEEFTYNASGFVISAEDDDSVVTIARDTLGRAFEEHIGWDNPATVTRTVKRDFNLTGNVTKVTYPDNTAIDYLIDGDVDRIGTCQPG